VFQECQCQSKQYKPGRHIHECTENESRFAKAMKEGVSDGGEKTGHGEDDDDEGECHNWDCSDSQTCKTPEFLLCIIGERKVPTETVDTTKDDAKAEQEQDVVHPAMLMMLWSVERGDVRLVWGEGRWICLYYVHNSRKEGEGKCDDRKKENVNDGQRELNQPERLTSEGVANGSDTGFQ